jgi:hypothetical protein
MLHFAFIFFLLPLSCEKPAHTPLPPHLILSPDPLSVVISRDSPSLAVTSCTQRASLAVVLPLDFGLALKVVDELPPHLHPVA